MKDKDKIKSEIERLLNKEWKWGSSIEAKFRCEAYKELLEFIDSLPEEKVGEDLEEAAMMHYKDVLERKVQTGMETANMTSFKAGAKWQKEQIINKAYEWWENFYAPDGSIIPEHIRRLKEFRKAMEE